MRFEKSSAHRILRAQKWKNYIPRLVHTLNEDDVVVGNIGGWECTVAEGGHFEHVREVYEEVHCSLWQKKVRYEELSNIVAKQTATKGHNSKSHCKV